MTEVTQTPLERYVLRVLKVWDDADIGSEGLTWRATTVNVGFAANCSDVFYWGTADAEGIGPDDLDLLEQCLADLRATEDVAAECYVPELFAARKRGMRPQTPFGRKYDRHAQSYPEDTMAPKVRALFDAAGPVRDRKDEG